MPMEIAWQYHFGAGKATPQALLSRLGCLPHTCAGAGAGEQWVGSGLRHEAGMWVTPQWLILVLLLSKKVQISFFVAHSLSLAAVRPVPQMLRPPTGTTVTMTGSSPASPFLPLALSTPKPPTRMDLAKARSSFLGRTQLSLPHTLATTMFLSAVPGSSRHLLTCHLLRYLSVPCHDPTSYAQPLHAFRRHNHLCVSLASPVWCICSLFSARSSTRVSLPMHMGGLYMYSSHAGL